MMYPIRYKYIGSCEICGGDVIGYRGLWRCSFAPPPKDRCVDCGVLSRPATTDVDPLIGPNSTYVLPNT